jgi:hypothetical protein
MYPQTFSAAFAETHRADLMAAAEHARNHRRTRPERRRSHQPRLWRLPRPSFTFARPTAQLRDAT